ncbi:MAG: hypothetical protein IKO20_03965 [Bacteroidaceae bacterium]|nr:hypothetical protein [Bacteroidaceae bacterium]
MTLQEFNQLTGLNATEKEFENINEMYMAVGNMDKATFCKEYKQHGESKLVAELMNTVLLEEKVYHEINNEAHKLYDERDRLVDFLLEQSQVLSSTALLKKAIEIEDDHAEVIRKKINLGLPLCELDLDYIRENL